MRKDRAKQVFSTILNVVTWQANLVHFQDSSTGFVRALEILENPGKSLRPWKSLETLEKPWNFFYEALENLTELYSSNGAFSGLDNKHMKSLAIRASDCQDLLAKIQILARSEIERSQFKFRWLCFYGCSSLLNMIKYVHVKCRFSIVISRRCMSLLQYEILLFLYSKCISFRPIFLGKNALINKILQKFAMNSSVQLVSW